MMIKTLISILRKTNLRNITKHFFFRKFADRGGGGGSEWSAELLFGLKYDMIWLQFLTRATKERVGRFLRG